MMLGTRGPVTKDFPKFERFLNKDLEIYGGN